MTLFANPAGRNFLGNSAEWYKTTILAFLIINPILYYTAGAYVAGWVLILEFIFTLAMALKCYPLQPGGLLAIEAVALGMTSPETVVHEIQSNLEVIMLLVFMVAGIYFLKNMLLYVFTKILVHVRNKVVLSLIFSAMAALLSAFLDALTVTAVVIAISVGFYSIYHKVASGKDFHHDHDHSGDDEVDALNHDDLDQFRAFLRSLMMHAAVGTALGGVMTLVGEPQNILIAERAGWAFDEFFFRMLPVTLPVLFAGLATCALLEITGKFGYGTKVPEKVLNIIIDYDQYQGERRTKRDKVALVMQGIVALWLVVGLIIHISPGLVGLSVIVLASALNGITEEHQIGHAFEEALPFTALLVVFFSIVGVISDNGLFKPVTDFVLSLDTASAQITALYVANGILSAISDNVFVATIYVTETSKALANGIITRDTYDLMNVAINTGTNIPSVATPNGQAAFLFLLTSALAPLIRLSYMKMVVMALPYTIVMSIVGYIGVSMFLEPMTRDMYDAHLIEHHVAAPDGESDGSGH